MCTLTIAWRTFDDAPVAVAANRDEAIGRASSPPDVYREDPLVIAPRDERAGGTWIGYNERGVFAGVTNLWTDADLAGERSRGLLVVDALETSSAAEAAERVERTTEEFEYDGFFLVVADAADAICFRWDGALERTEFEPGVHVVVNVAVDDDARIPSHRADVARRQAENARAVRRALEPEADGSAHEWLDRVGDVLGDHDYGVCVHGDGFGTRSSSLIALGEASPGDDERGRDPAVRHEYADGPPCVTPYERVDVESQL
ncbi:NRDE family protein [Natrialbaceae archaeon GCM10025810]|uniref:NRDE family protein n=1 Tax=Halovalidus salilacus TaxID=3075124 RepID=UPI00360B059F